MRPSISLSLKTNPFSSMIVPVQNGCGPVGKNSTSLSSFVSGSLLMMAFSINGTKGLPASSAKGVFSIRSFFNAAFLQRLCRRFALRFVCCSQTRQQVNFSPSESSIGTFHCIVGDALVGFLS
jgi:hypothetical protein